MALGSRCVLRRLEKRLLWGVDTGISYMTASDHNILTVTNTGQHA